MAVIDKIFQNIISPGKRARNLLAWKVPLDVWEVALVAMAPHTVGSEIFART